MDGRQPYPRPGCVCRYCSSMRRNCCLRAVSLSGTADVDSWKKTLAKRAAARRGGEEWAGDTERQTGRGGSEDSFCCDWPCCTAPPTAWLRICEHPAQMDCDELLVTRPDQRNVGEGELAESVTGEIKGEHSVVERRRERAEGASSVRVDRVSPRSCG